MFEMEAHDLLLTCAKFLKPKLRDGRVMIDYAAKSGGELDDKSLFHSPSMSDTDQLISTVKSMTRVGKTSSQMRRDTPFPVVAPSTIVEIPAGLAEIKKLLCFRDTSPSLVVVLQIRRRHHLRSA